MRCPYCEAENDKVVDSRLADENRAIRRRRECLSCGRRYTTFERPEEVPIFVLKRSGEEEPFVRAKVVEGLLRACKNRPVSDAEIEAIAEDVEEAPTGDGLSRPPRSGVRSSSGCVPATRWPTFASRRCTRISRS
jgi:transcriptional repressor NrdR